VPKIGARRARSGLTKSVARRLRSTHIDARYARKRREFDTALCALRRFDAKKSKRIVARQLRTDKVFVYFT
jgi:hypothetical protein